MPTTFPARRVTKRRIRENKFKRGIEKFNQSIDNNLVLLQNLENLDENSILNYHSDFDDNPEPQSPDNELAKAEKSSKSPFNQTNQLGFRHKRSHVARRGPSKRNV